MPDKALEHGLAALSIAEAQGDEKWQLNINVLLGQAHMQLNNKLEAEKAFTTAYDLAVVSEGGCYNFRQFATTDCDMSTKQCQCSVFSISTDVLYVCKNIAYNYIRCKFVYLVRYCIANVQVNGG